MKVGILGAGSMGSLIGLFLSKKNEVILIDAYDPVVKKINEDGIYVVENDNSAHYYKASAYLSGECYIPVDLLVIFVKSTQLNEALRDNLGMISDKTVVLSLQNGMGNEEIISKYVAKDKILLGTTRHNAHVMELAKIKHSGEGLSHIGSLSGNHELARNIANKLNECGFKTFVDENVNRLLWEKLFINITVNALTSLIDVSMDYLKDDSPIDLAVDLILKEAIEVAKADGEEFKLEDVKKNVYKLTNTCVGGIASMLQDMQKKRKTEIDTINGSVVRIGKKYNVPTPVNELIVSLIHSKEDLF